MRLTKPPSRGGPLKYSTVNTSIFGLKKYYEMGLIQFPTKGDFQPWNNFIHTREEKVLQFYHPFQFLLVRECAINNNILLKPNYFESFDLNNCHKSIERLKQISATLVEDSRNRGKEIAPKVGLLMLLDQSYGPFVKNMKIEYDLSDIDRWNRWRANEFSTRTILEKVGMTYLLVVKELYNYVCTIGNSIDPLKNWFILLKLMKRSAIKRLEGKALLAQ